jgi:hypothetical protein
MLLRAAASAPSREWRLIPRELISGGVLDVHKDGCELLLHALGQKPSERRIMCAVFVFTNFQVP